MLGTAVAGQPSFPSVSIKETIAHKPGWSGLHAAGSKRSQGSLVLETARTGDTGKGPEAGDCGRQAHAAWFQIPVLPLSLNCSQSLHYPVPQSPHL